MTHREEYDEQLTMHIQVWSVPEYRDFRIATETQWDDMTEWEQALWNKRASEHYSLEQSAYTVAGGHRKWRK